MIKIKKPSKSVVLDPTTIEEKTSKVKKTYRGKTKKELKKELKKFKLLVSDLEARFTDLDKIPKFEKQCLRIYNLEISCRRGILRDFKKIAS